jgi:hypothetical protein
MNARLVRFLPLLAVAMLFQGCVAIPPLVNVQSRDNSQAFADLQRRLDSIDRRLDQLEHKQTAAARPAP